MVLSCPPPPPTFQSVIHSSALIYVKSRLYSSSSNTVRHVLLVNLNTVAHVWDVVNRFFNGRADEGILTQLAAACENQDQLLIILPMKRKSFIQTVIIRVSEIIHLIQEEHLNIACRFGIVVAPAHSKTSRTFIFGTRSISDYRQWMRSLKGSIRATKDHDRPPDLAGIPDHLTEASSSLGSVLRSVRSFLLQPGQHPSMVQRLNRHIRKMTSIIMLQPRPEILPERDIQTNMSVPSLTPPPRNDMESNFSFTEEPIYVEPTPPSETWGHGALRRHKSAPNLSSSSVTFDSETDCDDSLDCNNEQHSDVAQLTPGIPLSNTVPVLPTISTDMEQNPLSLLISRLDRALSMPGRLDFPEPPPPYSMRLLTRAYSTPASTKTHAPDF